MYNLPFRQIHLDFHTSPHLPDIGKKFDKIEYQKRLQSAYVNSITTFATCHHGWRYYKGKKGEMHPNLDFDLLRAQFDACKEIGINVPIYLTAGVNDYAYIKHPDWHEISPDGHLQGWTDSNLKPGFHVMCFNTPYLDFLCEQISEVVTLFPDNDGIFLDIITQGECCCTRCVSSMHEKGYDPTKKEDRLKHSKEVLANYFKRTTEAARITNPKNAIFHNSGHITVGNRDILPYFSHLELESLPTGGWGYDHFPMSAKYVQKLSFDFLGMTGKFHTTWGEFGGFKHPNALRYECAAMIAFNAKCSVGDQLHPLAELDATTYNLIGTAYKEVAEKEAWCIDASAVSEIALVSQVPYSPNQETYPGDIGAGRMLLEAHFQFDVLDQAHSFEGYRVLIIPDSIRFDEELSVKVQVFIDNGGKVILSGESGLKVDGTGFALDLGLNYQGESDNTPNYMLPTADLRPAYQSTPFVSYVKSQNVKATTGTSIGDIYESYFNRTYKHYSSHQHTPFKPEPSGFDLGVCTQNTLYFSHPVFSLYRGYGATIYKDFVVRAIKSFMGNDVMIDTNLPSTARISINEQIKKSRYVLHLLYASTISRGGAMQLSGGNLDADNASIEIIEDLLPLYNTVVSCKLPKQVKSATLEPQGICLPITQKGDRFEITVKEFTCHQMIALEYTD